MSREVDRSDLSSLSKDDLLYLRDRGQLTPEEEAEHLGEFTPEHQAPTIAPNIGDVATTPAELAEGEEEQEYDDNYDEVGNDALKDELEARGLKKSGKREDLIARLREDDAAKAAESEDEDEEGEED